MSAAKTPQQIANLREALEVWWPSVPEANVSPKLNYWRDPYAFAATPQCGTVCCFGGWATRWPALQAQGISMDGSGAPILDAVDACDYEVAAILFGDANLFMWRDRHPADQGFIGTDHELVTNRLRWALEH